LFLVGLGVLWGVVFAVGGWLGVVFSTQERGDQRKKGRSYRQKPRRGGGGGGAKKKNAAEAKGNRGEMKSGKM